MDVRIRPSRRRVALPILALLAGASLLTHGATPAAAKKAKSRTLTLNGTVSGRFIPAPTSADFGGLYVISASGKVKPLGRTVVNGNVHTPGLVATGNATGQLVLSSGQGKVTLELLGPPQDGFSPPPTQMQFTVTGGEGAFLHATGSGTVDLVWGEQQKVTLTFSTTASE